MMFVWCAWLFILALAGLHLFAWLVMPQSHRPPLRSGQ
jgi:hypothetical protein